MIGGATQLLTNGHYQVLLTEAGGGYASLGPVALTRWTPDPTRDADGVFVYLRDLESGAYWSAGHQPICRPAARYETRFDARVAAIVREDDGIATRLDVAVSPSRDVEVRRLTLTNPGDAARRMDVTTYAEVALNHPAADAAHPAFSKLFVQTEFCADREVLVARRRPRGANEVLVVLAHALWLRLDGTRDALEFETDRARFIGRGRSLAAPAALATGAPLSGTAGNVLDPVLSLRRAFVLAPGSSVTLVALFAAGTDERAVVDLVAGDGPFHAIREVFPDVALTGAPPIPAEASRPPSPEGRGGQGVRTSVPRASALPDPWVPAGGSEPLRGFNGYGGFSGDGSEYVIRRRPPQPWVNVIANEGFGFLVSERGAGTTWSVNSRENRLTPWFNDPVTDPHGEACYVRDEESGCFWSPTPGPAPGAGSYEVRHGFGYSRFVHDGQELMHDLVMFVAERDPVKLCRLRVTNRSSRRRRLSFTSYCEWVLGGLRQETARAIVTERDGTTGAILARNPEGGPYGDLVAFAALVPPQAPETIEATADRLAFLGRHGTAARPAALASGGTLDGRTGVGLDPCAALRVAFDLAPGETGECGVLLGQAQGRADALELVRRYRQPGAIARALDDARSFWRRTLSAIEVATPSPAIDLMLNGWLAYQTLSCRLWGRSAFYQSGGAYGFRDQLQDAAAMVYVSPDLTRRQILLHAAHQFPEGDVLHWWHPPGGRGIRSRCSDDLLFLPYVTAFYVQTTGDASVLDEAPTFVSAPALRDGEDEAVVRPMRADAGATVYQHCCLALDRSLSRGRHGLPLIGTGDWNDGMNRVGREGRGESVWLGFFLYAVLDAFVPLCDDRNDAARAARYREHQVALAGALETAGWDGAWYRRAYYDDGAPIGSAESDECRIDAIAQAWAVLSRVASAERAAQALDALEHHLVVEDAGLIRLLTPPFDRGRRDPGYIKGYLPGVRENGGQYTHGVLWAVRACAELGRAERAAPLLEMLTPVRHGDTPERIATYQAEPYVVAADVYGAAPHLGRGGWTWYTGSAGWMFRVALESVLGFTLREGNRLVLRPCIPSAWPGFTVRYRRPGGRTTYELVVRRTAGATRVGGAGPGAGVEDGAVVIPLRDDGREHRVDIALGSDVGPRYRTRAAAGATFTP